MGLIAKCPPELTIYLQHNLYNKTKSIRKPRNKIIKVKDPITNEEVEDEEDNIDLGVYKFAFSDHLIKRIFNNLPKEYYTDYVEWLKMTTALKTLGKKEIWHEISKKHGGKSYNKDKNNYNWDGIVDHNKLFMVNHILHNCKLKNARCMLDYYKYKPTPEDTIKPNNVIDKQKLGYEYFIENQGNNITKSDTGTGKTTSFKTGIKGKKFISIVSRVSLGVEQMRIFTESGLKVYWHEDISNECKKGAFWSMWEGDNIVITVDSLLKLQNWDHYTFKDYTIYLDEFNSLIEHLITSPTMQKTRIEVYNMLLRMLNNCDRFIGTDADINDISLRYLQANGLDFTYNVNTYKHNNGIEATEIFSFNKFIKAVNKEDKWLICCDSKTQAEVIAHVGNKNDYLLITSEGWLDSKTKTFIKGYKSLDSHDRIIYSPAVLYGLDSVIKRPVFCYYKGRTIDPAKMKQQICRCRNITNVKYLFTCKEWQPYNYHDFTEIEEEITQHQQYGYKLFNLCGDIKQHITDDNKIYLELLAKYRYRADCYNTNKFAHFIQLMRKAGFKCPLVFTQTGEKGVSKALDEVKEIKDLDLFDMDRCYNESKKEDPQPIDYYPQAFIKTNEILKIPWGQLYNYKEMFLCAGALTHHITTIDYFNKDKEQIESKLLDKQDFIINLTTTNESALLTLTKFKNMCQHESTDKQNVILDKPLDKKTAEIFFKEYKLVFRCRKFKYLPDYTNIKECQSTFVQMYKSCFGKDIIDNRKTTKNGKSHVVYTFNQDYLEEHNKLYSYRKPKIEELGEDCLC